MKAAYLLLPLSLVLACGKNSNKNPDADLIAAEINNSRQSPDFNPQSPDLALADKVYVKNSENSVIECLALPEGDKNCRLTSKEIVLAANPEGKDNAYRVDYENTCKFAADIPEATFKSGIVMKAQPDSEGDVHGTIYLNTKGSLVIRGTGDLRVQEPTLAQLGKTLEKGCSLVISYTLLSSK